jgi:hypothetical protein
MFDRIAFDPQVLGGRAFDGCGSLCRLLLGRWPTGHHSRRFCWDSWILNMRISNKPLNTQSGWHRKKSGFPEVISVEESRYRIRFLPIGSTER